LALTSTAVESTVACFENRSDPSPTSIMLLLDKLPEANFGRLRDDPAICRARAIL